MARVFKPWWTAPIPAKGRLYEFMGQRFCEYHSRGKKKSAEIVTVKGVDRLKIESDVYYCEYFPHDRPTKPERVKSAGDKRSAESHLARLLREDDERRAGRAVPDGSLIGQTLGGWKKEYVEVLKARDLSPDYVVLVDGYLDTILTGCRWKVWADVGPDRLQIWLSQRREATKCGPATLNSYLRVAKGFSNWLADRLGTHSPLRGKALPFFTEAVDLRRSKRMLTDTELAAVIAAAERSPRRVQGFGGIARAMLYRMAAYSGLRASELAALTPLQFDLHSTPPCVRPEAATDKAKRGDPLPLPTHLVELLKVWLEGKDPKARLWPGTWAENRRQVIWLANDLKRAGVAPTDAKGRKVTFHSFRRRYITGLIRNGADIDQVKRLGRHKDIKTTLSYYTDSDLPGLAEAVNRIPQPPAFAPKLGAEEKRA
jgi:integrase